MSVTQSMKLLYRAPNMIERDAILSQLTEAGIEAITTPRDMSRQVSEGTLDLGLEGYSTFFDGFPIYVKEEDQEAAEGILLEAIRSHVEFQVEEPAAPNHWHRFYFSALGCLIVPGLMHALAIWHYMKARRSSTPPRKLFLMFSWVLYLVTLPLLVLYLRQIFFKH